MARTTPAEAVLKRALKKERLPYRKHHYIGRWEVDFLVADRVVVEVDGYVHVQKSVREKDARKNAALQEAGYKEESVCGNGRVAKR